MEYHKLPEHIAQLEAKASKARELYEEINKHSTSSGKVEIGLRNPGTYGKCYVSSESLQKLLLIEMGDIDQKLANAKEQHETLQKVAKGLLSK